MRLELNRRKFLKLAGAAALTVSVNTLTACGGGGSSSASSSNSSSSQPDTPENPDNTPDEDNGPEESNPEETDGIAWIYQKTGTATAALLGYNSSSGKIPSGDVTLPGVIDGLEITQIGVSAFANQTWTIVDIPTSVQIISETAFTGCSGLNQVILHDGLKTISSKAFSSTGLTSVSIPASVTTLGSNIFDNCNKLQKIQILGDPSCSASPLGVLTALESVTLSDHFTKIADSMFFDCTSLSQINFPDTLSQIGSAAFQNCQSLKCSIKLPPHLTSLGHESFYQSGITSITIPGCISSVPHSAFSGCKNLVQAVIEKGVTTIETSAFSGCSSLLYVDLPEGLTQIGNSAFSGCILPQLRLPQSLSTIGSTAFYGCHTTNIQLPQTMTEIGIYAFQDCPLTLIVIPDHVFIREGAFIQWNSQSHPVKKLYLPKGCHFEYKSFDNALDPDTAEIYYGGTDDDWKFLKSTLVTYDRSNKCIAECKHVYCNVPRSVVENMNIF